MRYPRHVLSLFVPLLVLACENQVTDPEAGSLADSPLFKKCSSPPCGGGGGPGDGTPADPAIAYIDSYDLKVMNEDGSNQTTVYTDDTYRPSGPPSWSPDGTRIALRGRYPDPPLVVIDLTLDSNGIPVGSTPTQLTTDQVFDPAWSPTSDLIAYAGLVDGDNRYLMTVSANGGPSTNTIIYKTPTATCHPWNPTWSPDGGQIAFLTECDGLSALRILTLAEAPTQSSLTLIDEGVFYGLSYPDWSRDGTRIAFRGRKTSESNTAVYIVDVATGQWRESGLSQPYYLGSFSWSPDDSKLVVDLDRAVRLVDATTGQVIPKRKSKLASGGRPNWRRCETGPGCGLSP